MIDAQNFRAVALHLGFSADSQEVSDVLHKNYGENGEVIRVPSHGGAAQKKWYLFVVGLVQVLTMPTLLSLIQSIPSTKADPFPEVRLAAAS